MYIYMICSMINVMKSRCYQKKYQKEPNGNQRQTFMWKDEVGDAIAGTDNSTSEDPETGDGPWHKDLKSQ